MFQLDWSVFCVDSGRPVVQQTTQEAVPNIEISLVSVLLDCDPVSFLAALLIGGAACPPMAASCCRARQLGREP